MHQVLKSERQQKIMEEVAKKDIVSVIEMAELFDVSEITIRRDLDELVEARLLERVHGGARRNIRYGVEPSVMLRCQQNIKEKYAIATQAAKIVEEGDAIALEAGSTTLALAQQIAQRQWDNLQVTTNSFPILNILIHIPTITVIFIGGLLDHNEACTYGPFTEDNLSHLKVKKLFTGCRGLDLNIGRTNDFQASLEIDTVRAFSNASEKLYLLADHTKFGRVFPLQLLSVDKIDVLITSELTPQSTLQLYQDLGVEIIVAGLNNENTPENSGR